MRYVRSLLTTLVTIMVVLIVAMFLTFASTIDVADVKDLPINNLFSGNSKDILENGELTIPKVYGEQITPIAIKPHSSSTFSPGYEISTSYQHAGLYKGTTGVLDITVENTGQTTLFIYKYGIEPYDGSFRGYDTGQTIEPGDEQHIGLISIEVPSNTDNVEMKIGLGILAKGSSGTWYDYGTEFLDEIVIDTEPVPTTTELEYFYNTEPFFTATNDKIDPRNEDVRAVAASGIAMYPGEYNVYQLCALFDYVKNDIKYMSDPRGNDYWATPNETLKVKAGDCDDSAILLSSLIEAIGGTSRLYITDTHVFATAYIGKGEEASKITDAVKDKYGGVPVYYTTDEYGSWLIMDTTSGLYAGDISADATPSANGWKFTDTEEVIIIDIVPK
ncbi:transglutaminase-like domain-containing protein [Methanococcoides seepicolus]|uniref:Transglutaminase family protein n=1 Tax=Methanococcoides seepicolus TaxID=2828780 RepID=A0A9E4ZEQ4_9EURY|nr:transglutaminase family protein [Methanococcoides seepicolus]MCM1986221.1 transglutaminase family protein [Methanococcoides seepicolus]